MISVNSRSRTISAPIAPPAAQPETNAVYKEKLTAACAEDEVSISPEAQKAMAKQAAASVEAASSVPEEQPDANDSTTAFTSFAEEFNKVTQKYSDQIQEYYAKEHAENLTYDDPRLHIWDKYKNQESPEFRTDLSEDERAWAYDQELDLLNGGKHLQICNPYAFPEGIPTLASAAREANQVCREQINQALQDLLTRNEIVFPEDAAFSLTVDKAYTIHVNGLEDEELTSALEQALNCGENGKNLYGHLKLSTPAGEPLSVDYVDGHISAVDAEQEWDDMGLREVKMQAGPAWTQYSATYDPHQGPLSDKVLSLEPSQQVTQEQFDRMCAAVRMGAQQAIVEYCAQHPQRSLRDNYVFTGISSARSEPVVASGRSLEEAAVIKPLSDMGKEDMDTVFMDHFTAIMNQLVAKTAVMEDYYAEQHTEIMQFSNPYQYIMDRYVDYNFPISGVT